MQALLVPRAFLCLPFKFQLSFSVAVSEMQGVSRGVDGGREGTEKWAMAFKGVRASVLSCGNLTHLAKV